MSEDQKKYYNAMKKLGSKQPQKPIPKPRVCSCTLSCMFCNVSQLDVTVHWCLRYRAPRSGWYLPGGRGTCHWNLGSLSLELDLAPDVHKSRLLAFSLTLPVIYDAL